MKSVFVYAAAIILALLAGPGASYPVHASCKLTW